ncbi:hypothetical protein BD408DRAFT_438598 [Parasitella parasitica]|nr:hypothetical protein BD408DRAFT_438598 [Parasitella parasitica]
MTIGSMLDEEVLVGLGTAYTFPEQTKPTTNTIPQTGTSPANTNTVSSSSRLTTTRQSAPTKHISKLPLAQKRRLSTFKATTVPTRTSSRLKKQFTADNDVDSSITMDSTATIPDTNVTPPVITPTLTAPRPEAVQPHPGILT